MPFHSRCKSTMKIKCNKTYKCEFRSIKDKRDKYYGMTNGKQELLAREIQGTSFRKAGVLQTDQENTSPACRSLPDKHYLLPKGMWVL